MKKRIFICVLVLSLFIVITSLGFSLIASHSSFIEERNRSINAILENVLRLDYNREQMVDLLRGLPKNYFRATYIASNGNVLFESSASTEHIASHAHRPEVIEAMHHGYGSDVRTSDTIGEEYHYRATKLKNGDILRLSYSSKSIWGILNEHYINLLLFGIIIIALCAPAASIISNIIVKPINAAQKNPEEYIDGYKELAPFQQKILLQKNELVRRAQESESNSRQFRHILDSLQEGLIILDNKLNIININASARRIFNYYTDRPEHIYNACREDGFINFVKAFSENKQDRYTYILDASVYSMHVSQVMQNDGSKAYVLLIQNITSDYYNEKLRREFSSNVSHELKTPLTTISGLTELIANNMVKNSDIPGFAAKIQKETKRLVRLIDDIIKLSHIDEGQGFELKPISLDEIAKDQVERYSEIAKNMNITLDSDKASIMGEPLLIADMISNLIDNAIKYNKHGTNIRVRIKNKANGVVLSVEDDGIGIEKKHHARIFERFYRVDKSHSRNTGGTGLGLSIVKNAAVLHNAKLDIESDINQGCIIKIRFPKIAK